MNKYIINTDLIKETILKNRISLEKKLLCEHSDCSPSKADYSNKTFQSIYTIKYFPAYYFEYCVLSNRLNQYLKKKKIKKINIISLGSGSCADYYALNNNLVDIEHYTYTGIDLNDWDRDLFPIIDKKNFIFKKISALEIKNFDDYQVIFFPKSISNIFGEDINSETEKNINTFINDLIKSNRDEIIFCISYEHYYAKEHFIYLSKILNSKGYYIADSRNSKNNAGQSWYIGDKCYNDDYGVYTYQNLNELNNFFYYENIGCNNLMCNKRDSCYIMRGSLKKNRLIQYNYFVFKRKNDDY